MGIYNVLLLASLMTLLLSEAEGGARLMGCYRETSTTARLMGGEHKNFPGSLTPEKCIAHCRNKGFKYAGTQYGQECFCSNERPPYKSLAELAEDCNMKCDGDQDKKCGGVMRLSVYDIQNKKVNHVQSQYVACYKDESAERRSLRGKGGFPIERPEMTPEYCVGHCFSLGYRYAGVQYKSQCFCGDRLEGERREEDNCDLDCSGDPRLTCGGAWTNSVYHTGIADESTQGRFLGCFEDSVSHRTLSGHKTNLRETNTPQRCMNLCKVLGFQYSGVEYREECFCGNKRPEQSLERNERDCAGLCPVTGAVRACGGTNRIGVYSTAGGAGHHGGVTAPSTGPALIAQPSVILVPGGMPADSLGPDRRPSPTGTLAVTTISGGAGHHQSNGTTTVLGTTTGGEVLVFTPGAVVTRRPPPSAAGGSGTAGVLSNSGPGSTSQYCTKPTKTELPAAGKSLCSGELIFRETFDTWAPDTWKHEIFMPDGPDYEFVVFEDNRENIFLQDGKLVIKPTIYQDDFVRRGKIRLEKCTGRMFTDECDREARGFSLLPPVRSARISTKNFFSFKYGKVTVRARLPLGDWLVPEIWLEPKERVYGAGYKSGRLRLAVSLGNQRLRYSGEELGSGRLEAGLLMGTESRIRGRKLIKTNRGGRGWYEDFHNYTLVWSPDNISFQIDGGEVESLIPAGKGGKLYQLVGFDRNTVEEWGQGSSIAPFDQQFYLSLGVSVGGMREFPDNCITGKDHAKPWNNMAVKGLVDFWNDRENWYPTWNNNKFGLEIEDISVYAL